MQQYKLNVVTREETGRGPVRRLRAAGQIPANVYSKGNARSISLSAVEFRELSRQIGDEAALIELTDDKGESMLTLVQDVQHNALRGTVNHIDFHEVKRGEDMTAHIPVHVIGEDECVGVKVGGGLVEIHMHEVDVRCRPSKLPEHIDVNVAELEAGETVQIANLPAIEGVAYLGNAETVVVSCSAPNKAADEDASEGAAE